MVITHLFLVATLLCGGLLLQCANCTDTQAPAPHIPRNDAQDPEISTAESNEALLEPSTNPLPASMSVAQSSAAAAFGADPPVQALQRTAIPSGTSGTNNRCAASSSLPNSRMPIAQLREKAHIHLFFGINDLKRQLAEIDKPGERYNFRPLSIILFAIYCFVSDLTRSRPFGFRPDKIADKRAFITKQFTEGKFSGPGQFFCPHWIDSRGRDVFSILLAKYTVSRPFNVQVYEAIPIDEYNESRHYTEENMGKINIHSFIYVFAGRFRYPLIADTLRDELFPAIEQNCAGESKFNLCIIQHVMCFGVQLHYNLQLLKAYTLKMDLERMQTRSAQLLLWRAKGLNNLPIAYTSPLEFYVDAIRSKFHAQWMQETAERITRHKDIKPVPNPISPSSSLKAQIEHKLATIRNKYESITVQIIETVKEHNRKRKRGE